MTAVCTTYILMAPEGLGLSSALAYPVGAVASLMVLGWFLLMAMRKAKGQSAISVRGGH